MGDGQRKTLLKSARDPDKGEEVLGLGSGMGSKWHTSWSFCNLIHSPALTPLH